MWHWQPGLESRWRHLLLPTRGWMAEWSKALVLGTSNFGCAGSNPAPVIRFLPAGAPKREGTTRFELVTCGSAIRCSTTELCTHRLETCRRGSQGIPLANEVFLVGVVGNISACHADAPGSIPGRGALIPHSLVGQDTALSLLRPGFKSRWGNTFGSAGGDDPRPI